MSFDETKNNLDISYMPYLNPDSYKDYIDFSNDQDMNRIDGAGSGSNLNQMNNNYQQAANTNNQPGEDYTEMPNYSQQTQGNYYQGFNQNMVNPNTRPQNAQNMPNSNANSYFANFANTGGNQNQTGTNQQSVNPNMYPGINFMGSDVIIMIPGVIRGTMQGLPVVIPQSMDFGGGMTPYGANMGGSNMGGSSNMSTSANGWMNNPTSNNTGSKMNNPMNSNMNKLPSGSSTGSTANSSKYGINFGTYSNSSVSTPNMSSTPSSSGTPRYVSNVDPAQINQEELDEEEM